MRRVVLKSIMNLGRYAVLPVVALACAILVVWLMAIDRYRILALVTAPIVVPATSAAIALALGLVLLPSRRNATHAVNEHAAPGLWALWGELDRAVSPSGRTLLIDAAFNASISEERRYLGLFKRHVTMTVGLPLLMILDARAIRAVIAHEVAHACLQHTSGGTNLYEFIAAAENVFHYADPDRTVTGRVAYLLLHALVEWLEKEHRALSRQNELCADGDAAQQVGRDEMARALVLAEGAGARLADLVFAPLDNELRGAIRVPIPPFQRIFNQREDIRAPEPLADAAADRLTSEQNAEATHPPLGARLASLGFSNIPQIDKVQTSAADALLSPEAGKELAARFDNEWRKTAEELVGLNR